MMTAVKELPNFLVPSRALAVGVSLKERIEHSARLHADALFRKEMLDWIGETDMTPQGGADVSPSMMEEQIWCCPKCGGREKSEPLYVPKGSLPRLRELHGAVTMAALRAEAGTTGATEDCLYWSCKTCGFVWHELCKDAQETIYAQ
jgi:rubredoxin